MVLVVGRDADSPWRGRGGAGREVRGSLEMTSLVLIRQDTSEAIRGRVVTLAVAAEAKAALVSSQVFRDT
ncbi:hypothetical protein E2C01_011927 [Portunus trituberculatus]|uniref:Uncharacterized protein n=1 Tax=Portunus trituberculatus TaxID=210409 RepID=A0A5B7DCK2_PORTR|nr:hypothetical protein [Portunus trituberculatus]